GRGGGARRPRRCPPRPRDLPGLLLVPNFVVRRVVPLRRIAGSPVSHRPVWAVNVWRRVEAVRRVRARGSRDGGDGGSGSLVVVGGVVRGRCRGGLRRRP